MDGVLGICVRISRAVLLGLASWALRVCSGALPSFWGDARGSFGVGFTAVFAFFQFVFAFVLYIFWAFVVLVFALDPNHSRAARRPFVGAGRLASSSVFRQILLTTTIVSKLSNLAVVFSHLISFVHALSPHHHLALTPGPNVRLPIIVLAVSLFRGIYTHDSPSYQLILRTYAPPYADAEWN